MVTKTGPINNNIIVNPKIRFGKPCIRGTRIAVTDILNLLKAGYTIKEIPTQYPGITTADVRAALRYAAQVLGKEEILTIE
ncbi:MAG TPA: DUF433 domain-containing protein [Candidatus Moranbacteria bacterium]|nr:DUF433 domain-containing protein [Candidatus Moranbacteria bacterium]